MELDASFLGAGWRGRVTREMVRQIEQKAIKRLLRAFRVQDVAAQLRMFGATMRPGAGLTCAWLRSGIG